MAQCSRRMSSKLGSTRFLMLLVSVSILLLLYKLYLRENADLTSLDSLDYCNSPHYTTGEESESKLQSYKLKQVQVLVRHGDRAPIHQSALPSIDPVKISCIFNDTMPLKAYKKIANDVFSVIGSKKTELLHERTECKGGQLTPEGFKQHLLNGEHLKRAYRDFIVGIDADSEIFVEATDHTRTIQSAAALIVGMFSEQLMLHNWNVAIHVYADHLADSHLILDENNDQLKCPVLQKKLWALRTSSDFLTFISNTDPLVRTIASILQIKPESMPAFNRIVDIFYVNICHFKRIPRGAKATLPKSLVKNTLSFSHIYAHVVHNNMYELQTLPLLSHIARYAIRAILNRDNLKKFVVYSGHDSMIAPFLRLLGIDDGKWPPYASRIVFELFTKDVVHVGEVSIAEKLKSAYFRFIYNGVIGKGLKFCSTTELGAGFCQLTDLIAYVSDKVYDEHMDPLDDATLENILFTRIKHLCKA